MTFRNSLKQRCKGDGIEAFHCIMSHYTNIEPRMNKNAATTINNKLHRTMDISWHIIY